MNAPKAGAHWTVKDYATKIKFLFGQNLFELVPENDPRQDWFRGRISLPDYDANQFRAAPPDTLGADALRTLVLDPVYQLK